MPLTGVPLDFGQVPPDRPALVVKIDNNPRARPQSGLNTADIVFEEIVEVGTRFAAVFHSGDANPVGPIRSGRTQDIDLLSGLHRPLFAWSGGNAGVTRAIAESDFIDLNPNNVRGVYRRQGSNGAPHNFYSDTDLLFAQATPEAGRPTPLFAYLKPGVAAGGHRRQPRRGADGLRPCGVGLGRPRPGVVSAPPTGASTPTATPATGQRGQRRRARHAVPAELRRFAAAPRRSPSAAATPSCSPAAR